MPSPPIYFVSDTHLGDGSSADRFRYPRQLVDLLGRIEAEPRAHLVLLGDFMELWAAELEPILVHHTPVIGAILRVANKHLVTYVVGNHDCLPWYYYLGQRIGPIEITEQFATPDGSLVALHGHQFDPFNQVTVEHDGDVKPPLSRKLVTALGVIERLGGDQVSDAISHIGDKIHDILQRESPGERGYPPEEGIYIEAARGLMTRGTRFVLMGHTHHPMLRRFGRNVYVNTGSWVWDRYPPTYARFAGGRLELLEANSHRPFRA